MTPSSAWRRVGARPLIPLLLVAALLRLATVPLDAIHHADELWQYLEPAHKLVFGTWVRTWEWREGIRTWLLPTVLAGPMSIGAWLDPDGNLFLRLPRAAAALLSLLIVGYAYAFGARISRTHAVFAGFITAIWFELVYFGPHTLSEPIGVALFLPAAWLLSERATTGRGRLIAGLLLGLAFAIRFQMAPAMLVIVLAGCRLNIRAWGQVIAGGMIGLAIDVAADLAQGQTPLLWILNNFHINLIENRSASFGVEPAWYYLGHFFTVWHFVAPPILALAVVGARRYPILALAAIVNLAAHSAIPHKEYRFVLLTVTLLVLLAAIGTADIVKRWGEGRSRKQQLVAAITAALLWLAASVGLSFAKPFEREWTSHSKIFRSWRMAAASPGSCGLAFYRSDHPLVAAYTFYQRSGPIYVFYGDDAEMQAKRMTPAFNTVIAAYEHGSDLAPQYRLEGCSQKIKPGRRPPPRYCVYRRAGPCDPAGAGPFLIDAQLERAGK